MDAPTDLRQLVASATRAPSSHNTQPWVFRTTGTTIELYADQDRRLPVNDPHDRELRISCGAALETLAVAAAAAGWHPAVAVLPDGEGPLLARVSLQPAGPVAADLSPAVGLRATIRGPFGDDPVDRAVVDRARRAAGAAGVWVAPLDQDERRELARLVEEGDRLQFGDRAWREELAAWMRPRRRRDGLGVPLLGAPLTRFVVRNLDLGARVGRQDRHLTETAPVLLVLSTDRDDPEAWVEAGRALQRLLLTAAAVGVQAGYLNQPCQVEQLRPRLSELVAQPFPQVVLRMGHPARRRPPSPRRPLDEVLRPGPA